LIEAAAIDGAGPWRRFWTIVFPLLSPTSFFLLVINIVYVFFDTFAIVDASTHGGPGKETEILVYKLYFDGFKAMDLRLFGRTVGGADGDRDRLHRGAVPLRRAESPVLMARSMVERRFRNFHGARRACAGRARRRVPGLPDHRRIVPHVAGDCAGTDAADAWATGFLRTIVAAWNGTRGAQVQQGAGGAA
jgi:hypothetical protein